MQRSTKQRKRVVIKNEPNDDQGAVRHTPAAGVKVSPNKLASNMNISLTAFGELYDVDDTAILERAVESGLQLAREISPVIDHLASLNTSSTARKDDVVRWQEAIEQIFSLARPTQTRIGVVGVTGAGKSSLVNSLVGEEKLLPTSCSRACTAWVTEVSYNYIDDATASYRAEIEYMTAEAWLGEVEALLQDIKDDISSGSSDHLDGNSDAGMAFSRLTAVYPGLTLETILSSDKSALNDNAEVQMVLGRTINLNDVSSKGLLDQMQAYMGRNSKEDVAKDMNPWPLIKAVRVFTKAPALSTGAVIVDLPGLHDSNAARAAVSTNYMKDCSGIWVVAPIIRAVDDKSAKELMGESFRRGMVFDGTWTAISFVASKTDDINVEEAAGELGCATDIDQDFARINTLTTETTALETELGVLKKQNNKDRDSLDDLRDEVDEWETAMGDIQEGESIHAATANLGKRKRADSDKSGMSSLMEAAIASYEESQVDQHLQDLKARAQDLRKRVKIDLETIKEKEQNLELKRQAKTSLLEGIKKSCIKKRNQVSSQRIKQDFADGIREVDEATSPDQNDVFYIPDKPPRDYEKVRDGLHVFCISSRAYQKLNGMMQNVDFDTGGYGNSDDTGIPSLQTHAQKLTESHRNSRCREILVKLQTLLASIACWITGLDIKRAGLDSSSIKTHLRRESVKFLNVGSVRLRIEMLSFTDLLLQNLTESLDACSEKLTKMLQINIYSKTNALAIAAELEATPYADRWFESQDDGGLGLVSHRTFKAVCRKKGVHAPRGRVAVDLHADLARPIYDGLMGDWEKVFTLKIPFLLQEFLSEFTQHQKNFHQVFVERYERSHHLAKALDSLNNHNHGSREGLSNLVVEIKNITAKYRGDAHQAVIQSIANGMEALYNRCLGIRGAGCKLRIQRAAEDHIETIKGTIFHDAVAKMQMELEDMEKFIGNKLATEVKFLLEKTRSVYSGILLGSQRGKLSPAELKLKDDLYVILQSVNSRFRRTN
ncbi:Putative P-loop containing nucleoside triphosphate hydrolase, dynamin [Colletotrichum destructivum]|uniref:P-loop containing nucleoside triphosphate hydrolase, dynamin n=1 Tax=Colletotrichum destructivum TaxID=34406 RepID=A0AAX4J119_9PEZI|nr:Putative P-loop containing nucleoside triphosphate hydrolase, dynamin [Colletotrichum destructivum]